MQPAGAEYKKCNWLEETTRIGRPVGRRQEDCLESRADDAFAPVWKNDSMEAALVITPITN